MLLIASGIKAQRPAYGKMSQLVREACLTGEGYAVVNAAKAKSGHKTPLLTAFVKASDKGVLEASGCKILAKYGDLYVVSIPITGIGELSCRPGVQRIEAGRGATAQMDTTNIIIGSDVLHEGLNLPHSFTGSGVVVGVQDIGFDLTHPTFYSADMKRYRIKAMWDQLSDDTIGSRMPVGRDYRDSLSLLTLGHPRDGLKQTHGTHTAGIAAGSGSEGIASPIAGASQGEGQTKLYSGVAPDADLCLVCNATGDDADLISPDDYYKFTYALDALGFKYIFDYADSVGKPCVINFSEGSYEDFRGDDMLYYEMLDSLVGPGHILVASSGNEGGRVNYLRKPHGEQSAEVDVSAFWHRNVLSFTTRSDENLALSISANGIERQYALKDILAAADSTLLDSMMIDTVKYRIAAVAYPDCYDSGKMVAEWLVSSAGYISNTFRLQLQGKDTDAELYRGSALFSTSAGDNTHSILSPGSAPCVICVGMTGYRVPFYNYQGKLMDYGGSRNGAIQPNSSVGPTYDGRVKPDVVAPGQNIVSSYSSFYLENNPEANDINSDVRHFTYNGRTYAWTSSMGSSMSSPVVAGAIALWLQANPRLTMQDCLDVFSKTCTHYDPSMAYPNNVYGYGQIDAAAGLKYILEKTSGIKNISFTEADDKIYTIDGRFAGNDLKALPQGIYIKGKRKILK